MKATKYKWVVLDKRGAPTPYGHAATLVYSSLRTANIDRKELDGLYPQHGPHKIARVTVTGGAREKLRND